MSREAMRIPSSAIRAVSSKAQVGSPLAFPWPNTWHTHRTDRFGFNTEQMCHLNPPWWFYEQHVFCSDPQEGDDVVLGNGLQESGRARQRLEPGPTGGEKGADNDDPRGGPSQGSYHQVPFDRVSEPTGSKIKIQNHIGNSL